MMRFGRKIEKKMIQHFLTAENFGKITAVKTAVKKCYIIFFYFLAKSHNFKNFSFFGKKY